MKEMRGSKRKATTESTQATSAKKCKKTKKRTINDVLRSMRQDTLESTVTKRNRHAEQDLASLKILIPMKKKLFGLNVTNALYGSMRYVQDLERKPRMKLKN